MSASNKVSYYMYRLFVLLGLVFICFPIHAQRLQKKNKKVIQFFMEHVLSQKGINKYYEYHTSDFTANLTNGKRITLEEDYEAAIDNLKGVPDLTFEILHLIAEGDFVVAHWRGSGTLTGTNRFFTEPLGKRAEVTGFTIYRLENEKIAEEWTLSNTSEVLRKLLAEKVK